MSKETTKEVLLEAGRRVFLERGYNHAGIDAILSEAGVPKGSFYYYFPSKEEFGLQVLNRFARGHDADLDRYLGDTSLRPLERLRRLVDATGKHLEQQQCRNGCLVGNLSQEMADQNEAFRNRLGEIFRGWSARYAGCLREAQEAGEIAASLDVEELAEFLLASWQGAILRAKTMRSTAPLRTFANLIFGSVLRP
jgi:TetR/AcrR family transcriptional regulator, transcriptional repressor for nem operon